jgi:hypothetical protein
MSLSGDQETAQVVDPKGTVRPPEGVGSLRPDKTDGDGDFLLAGPHQYAHCPQGGGRSHQHHLDHQGPGQGNRAYEEEDAPHSPAAVAVPLGQHAVQMATSMKKWMAAKGIQVLEHPPYSPDQASVDFLLFRRVK